MLKIKNHFHYFSLTGVSQVSAVTMALTALSGCSLHPNAQSPQGDNRGVDAAPYVWVSAGHDSQQVARYVTAETSCPEINLNGTLHAMTERAPGNSPDNFESVRVCESYIPQGIIKASINDIELNLMPYMAQKIVIMGDTGCRMKGSTFQNCNNIEGQGKPWVFAQLVESVLAEQPDVVVHVGDYHYREEACPPGNTGCTGPWGFNWASWQADFFEPARPLLEQVPWIFTRGNHEDCDRAYRGWFYLLDPAPLYANPWSECQKYSPPYKVNLGGLSIIEMDSATLPNAFSGTVDPQTQQQYATMFDQVNALSATSKTSWMATHRPIWAISSYMDEKTGEQALSMSDQTMQAALKTSKLGAFDERMNLLLAGHIHSFEAVSFTDQRPDLMVIGDSGTLLSPPITPALAAQKAQILAELGVKAENFFADSRFAYVVLERRGSRSWSVNFVDLQGKTKKRFVLDDNQLRPIVAF